MERLTELQPLAEPPRCELRFAPNAPATHDPTLVGRLLTHAPDPEKCVLNTEGMFCSPKLDEGKEVSPDPHDFQSTYDTIDKANETQDQCKRRLCESI